MKTPLSAPSLRANDFAARSVRLNASTEPMSGFGRAGAHRDADAGAHEIDPARELALLDQIVGLARGEEGHVRRSRPSGCGRPAATRTS